MEKRIRFAFFYQLIRTGYAILKKDKQFVLKYIVYASLAKYKPYKIVSYYIHLPGTSSNIMQLSFSFDIIKVLDEEDVPTIKSSIERDIENALYAKRLIV